MVSMVPDPRRITIRRMAMVQYESKENAGHRFWTARYGRYAIRIGVDPVWWTPKMRAWPSRWESDATTTPVLPAGVQG
jgi:hypothetical protein